MAFQTRRPLRFGDCDPSGIAYFPSYLNILVGVLEDFFASMDASWRSLMEVDRIGTPTIRLDLTFVHPGIHGDQLDFLLDVRGVGRSSLDLGYIVSAAGKTLWTAEQRIVATSLDTHKSVPWPASVRDALEKHLETSDARNSAT